MTYIYPDTRRWTGRDYDAVNAAIQMHTDQIAELGLATETGSDAARFCRWRERFNDNVHPALDPAAGAHIPPTDFAYIALRDGGHRRDPVAVICARLWQGRMLDILYSRRFWGYDTPHLFDTPAWRVVDSDIIDRIEGRVVLQGGMIIDRAWQGKGLANNLMWLIRLCTLRTWHERWHVGSITVETHAKNMHIRKFGYDGAALMWDQPVSEGPKPDRDREYLVYADCNQLLDALTSSSDNSLRRKCVADATPPGIGNMSLVKYAPAFDPFAAQRISER